jgi:predicted alpha/beta hydrolase
VAVFVHEWRGHGTSSLRAGRTRDWGYCELLTQDIPASEAAIVTHVPGVERIVGGHSLGGQLASCYAGLSAHEVHRLWLVASGAPYWRSFPTPTRWWLPMAYRFLPWLAERAGALPGRRIGFGGNEARGLIRDWARTGLTGRYAARGLELDLEQALAASPLEVHAVLMAKDWLAPESSLRFLLSKLAASHVTTDVLGEAQLGAAADHFQWLQGPGPVVEALMAPRSV